MARYAALLRGYLLGKGAFLLSVSKCSNTFIWTNKANHPTWNSEGTRLKASLSSFLACHARDDLYSLTTKRHLFNFHSTILGKCNTLLRNTKSTSSLRHWIIPRRVYTPLVATMAGDSSDQPRPAPCHCYAGRFNGDTRYWGKRGRWDFLLSCGRPRAY